MRFVMVPLVFAALGLSSVTGCGDKKPSCDLLYRRLVKCENMPLKKNVYVEMCTAKAADYQAEIACSAKSDCAQFKQCREDARRAISIEHTRKRFNEAMAKNDIRDASMICSIHKKDLTPELQQKCADLGPMAFEQYMTQALEQRARGEKTSHSLCFDLKDLGRRLGVEKSRAAETVCRETELAITVKKALDEMEKNLAQKNDALSFSCKESTLKKFDEVGTDFAREKKKELIHACFVKMGRVILEKQVPLMKDFCTIAVKTVYSAVKQYQLQDPALDPLIQQAAPLCEK